MKELNVEQTIQTVQTEEQMTTTETEKQEQSVTGDTVSYGKFKDANALFSAYNALESEFTKRCQKIKELETQLLAVDKDKTPTKTEVEQEQKVKEEVENQAIKDYLKSILSRKQSAIVLDGAGVGGVTPIERPKTFQQAGLLAKELLK